MTAGATAPERASGLGSEVAWMGECCCAQMGMERGLRRVGQCGREGKRAGGCLVVPDVADH